MCTWLWACSHQNQWLDFLLSQSERLFVLAEDATSYHKENKEGKAGIRIWISLDVDVSILVHLFFFSNPSSSFTLYVNWKPNITGRGIRSSKSINRGSSNRKGGVARKSKIFITVSPSSAFRYAFTRRHLWGKTLLLYLSSTFYIFPLLTWRGLKPDERALPHRYLSLSPCIQLIARTFYTRPPRRKCYDRCRWWLNE